MKKVITKVHISLYIPTDDIEKNRKEIAKIFGIEPIDIHFNYDEIKEEEVKEC